MPDALLTALDTYRRSFKPSPQLDRPYAMAGVNVFAAMTDAEARRLFTSAQQAFLNLIRGARGRLPPPVDDIEPCWTPLEKAQVSARLACSFVGSAETVRDELKQFIERTRADEVMVVSAIFEDAARLRSYEIIADAFIQQR
jgi:alkanesulfonate monooxygenase SsuD/methylene tetrahydromethanopterin reductase-like flavin-dependent oxidoreductase (luciferase family)